MCQKASTTKTGQHIQRSMGPDLSLQTPEFKSVNEMLKFSGFLGFLGEFWFFEDFLKIFTGAAPWENYEVCPMCNVLITNTF